MPKIAQTVPMEESWRVWLAKCTPRCEKCFCCIFYIPIYSLLFTQVKYYIKPFTASLNVKHLKVRLSKMFHSLQSYHFLKCCTYLEKLDCFFLGQFQTNTFKIIYHENTVLLKLPVYNYFLNTFFHLSCLLKIQKCIA